MNWPAWFTQANVYASYDAVKKIRAVYFDAVGTVFIIEPCNFDFAVTWFQQSAEHIEIDARVC